MGDVPDGTQPVAEAILRYLARLLGGQQEVSDTALFPANRQETLVVAFDSEYYLDHVEDVRLELRVYTNGDFRISYIEIDLDEVRRCRWDRHD